MAANMWKNSLKNLESDDNKILYETLLNFFTAKRFLSLCTFLWYTEIYVNKDMVSYIVGRSGKG
jgi:hypothetical protein